MPISVFLEFKDVKGEVDEVNRQGDTLDFQTQLTTEPTDSDAGYLKPSSFQIISAGKDAVQDDGQLTVDPTNPNTEVDGGDFLTTEPTDGPLAISKSMDMANTQLIGPGDPLGNPDAVDDSAVYTVTVTNDTFDFQLTTEPTAPEPYMQHRFQDVIVSGQVITDDGSSDLLGPLDTLTSGYDAVAMEPVTLEGHQCLVFFLG